MLWMAAQCTLHRIPRLLTVLAGLLPRLSAWSWGHDLQKNDSFEDGRDSQESRPLEEMLKLAQQQLSKIVSLETAASKISQELRFPNKRCDRRSLKWRGWSAPPGSSWIQSGGRSASWREAGIITRTLQQNQIARGSLKLLAIT